MNEDLLRSIVREAVRRQIAARAELSPVPAPVDLSSHPSFARLTRVLGGEDGPCLVEPAVTCAHCGFCQSRGF